MNRYKTLILVAVISLMGSCAELQPVDSMALSNITFRKWVEKYAPDANHFVNDKGVKDSNIYIKYIHKAPLVHDTLKIQNMKWLRFNMNVFNLNSKTIAISDSILSHQAGKWTVATHWVPNYIQFDSLNPTLLSPGLTKVLPTLNIGDKLRIYLAAEESFSVQPYISIGNSGQLSLEEYINSPSYIDLHIVDVNLNAYTQLIDSMNNFALHKWNMQASDTIGEEGIFMKKTITNKEGDPIANDSLISMNVTRFFLDDFLVTTTSDSIAKLYDRYYPNDSQNTYAKIRGSIDAMENNPTLPKIYSIAPKHMRKGETALFLVNPYYTPDGYFGNTGALPAILPYEPTYYKIEIDTVTVTTDNDPII